VPTLRFQLFYERPSLPPQPLAEFRFPNPEFRSGAEAPPQWQPDPLPARPRPDPSSGGADGPPTLLETLQLRQDWQENTPFRRRYPIVQTVLELRTEPHAGALPNLEPTFLELSDATGNVWVSRILSTAPLGEGRSRIRTDLSGCLWSGEQAYRVKIEFRVPPGSPAASGMTVVETGPLAVPPPPRAASRLALEEVEVALSTIPTRRRGGTGPLPSLRVTLRSGRTGLTPVLLQATGPGDQPIRTTLLPGQGRLGSESTEVRLEAIPGPVRLKIGLYQAPVLTWVAAPAAPSQ